MLKGAGKWIKHHGNELISKPRHESSGVGKKQVHSEY